MKIQITLIASLLAACLCQAPRPVPIPSLDLSRIEGVWYVNFGFPASDFTGITCLSFDFWVVNSSLCFLS